jgi:hypothetical protein
MKGDQVMKTRYGGDLVIAVSAVLAVACSWLTPALAQAPPGGFASVVSAARAWPGCLGVETGQTSSGKRVIFAWFEDKKALVGWYRSDVHQKAMKTAFPNQTFDREPLPDTPEDSGPILAIVSVKLLDAPRPDTTSLPIATIGIELYTPLPGGVAVGGRFAPETIKVRGLREIELGSAQGRPR